MKCNATSVIVACVLVYCDSRIFFSTEMSEKNHFAALQEIRCWNTDDVISALNNNGLNECVDACKKRDITGEKLLELSEMKLGLWKRDLSIGNIRKLAAFIQDISKMPAKYTLCSVSSNSEDAWDTDFDDDETEEDDRQKTENNIPYGAKIEKKMEHVNGSQPNNGNLGVQNLVNRASNKQDDNRLSPINRNRTSQLWNKINIPSAFSSVHPSQNGSSTISSAQNITKPPFLKANGASEPVRNDTSSESKKPSIPSRPPSQHIKSSPKENVQSALPKPPAFDKEGSVLREICDKLQLEPDIMDEYESIDEDLIQAQSIKNQISQMNGIGGLSHSIPQNSVENPRKSPVPLSSGKNTNQQETLPISSLHRNQLYISKKINALTQQMTKPDQPTLVENSKRSPILPPAHAKKLEESLQTSKNLPSVNQEIIRRSPIPLPPRNEKRQDTSPTSTLNLTCQKNSQRTNEEGFSQASSVTPRLSKEYDDNKYDDENGENGISENMLHEEVYECIPEHISSKCSDMGSCEYSDGYLLPKAPPLLPPKPQQTSHNIKSSEKANNVESNGATGSSWSFGSLKHKSHQKTQQEKSSQDGKKNNTLPLPRPYISESPRPSASRPLPPPPPDGAVQRVIKIPLVQMPWYFNVDRARGEELLRNCEDGTFMIRPSTKTQNALTLTLKYGKRPFNICVRLRPDGRYALGTAKPTEQTFSSVEELVNHYTTNELLLYSNGKQAGIVVLTSPPRRDP